MCHQCRQDISYSVLFHTILHDTYTVNCNTELSFKGLYLQDVTISSTEAQCKPFPSPPLENNWANNLQ